MRITFKEKPKVYKQPKTTWFAWRPVKTLRGEWVWLETVRFEKSYGWDWCVVYRYWAL